MLQISRGRSEIESSRPPTSARALNVRFSYEPRRTRDSRGADRSGAEPLAASTSCVDSLLSLPPLPLLAKDLLSTPRQK